MDPMPRNALVFGQATSTTVSVVGGVLVPTCTFTSGGSTNSLQASSTIPFSIPDGLSNTIFWVEKLAYCSGKNGPSGNQWAASQNNSVYLPLTGWNAKTNVLPPKIQAEFNIGQAASCDPSLPSTCHSSLMATLGDGSVRSIANGVSTATLNIAFVPNDGLDLGSDW
jgi:hypothetical protein